MSRSGPIRSSAPTSRSATGRVIGAHVVIAGRTTLGAGIACFRSLPSARFRRTASTAGEPTRHGHRRRQRHPRVRHDPRRDGAGPGRDDDRQRQLAARLFATSRTTASSADDTTFSNNAQLAGHVVIEDWVTLGGFVGVHQFCRVGAHAMIAAGSIVLQDVPPFVTAAGYPAKPHGTNNEGLRRAGFAARRHRSRSDARTRRCTARPCRSTTRGRRSCRRRPRQPCSRRCRSSWRRRAAESSVERDRMAETAAVTRPRPSASSPAKPRATRSAAHADSQACARDCRGVRFAGVAGPRMQAPAARCGTRWKRSSVRGFVEVLRPRCPNSSRSGARHRVARLRGVSAPLFVGVDAPDFNLGLERAAEAPGRAHGALRQSRRSGRGGASASRASRERRPPARTVSLRAADLREREAAGHVRRASSGAARGRPLRRAAAKRASC